MSYYTFTLSHLDEAYTEWVQGMKDIRPYYAVKCNPHPAILERLARLGCGFDCASPAEIQAVLDLGVSSDDILYAHPCKRPDDLVWAQTKGIKVTTVDSVSEVYKIKKYAPEMHIIVRIRADDPGARCPMGNKYGSSEDQWSPLFLAVQSNELILDGISFHVGSGSSSLVAHHLAIQKALRAIQESKDYGHSPWLIDIGGGFTRGSLPKDLKADGYTLIAEPGRYFAEHVATLHTHVIGIKDHAYTIDDSLYGAFNCIVFDHVKPKPIVDEKRKVYPKKLFGCTCDGLDTIYDTIYLPQLSLGDEIVWPNMGAYTMAASTNFNGIPFSERNVFLKE